MDETAQGRRFKIRTLITEHGSSGSEVRMSSQTLVRSFAPSVTRIRATKKNPWQHGAKCRRELRNLSVANYTTYVLELTTDDATPLLDLQAIPHRQLLPSDYFSY
jgi:hypothetical protein